MSEQQPQPQYDSGNIPPAPFCPIDLPMRPMQGKLGSQEAFSSREIAPLLIPARSGAATHPANKKPGKPVNKATGKSVKVSIPSKPKARRRVKGSHDLLLRGGQAEQSNPQLLEETGEQLHPAPPLQRKPKKSKRNLERVRRRQMNYLQIRRQQKRKRLLYNRLRLMLKTCFAAFWVLVLWEVMHASFWMFDQPRVVLKNQQWLQAADIRPIVQAYAGQPVYLVDPARISADVKAGFLMVDDVYVRRRLFPARVELTVIEKTPWAQVYPSEKARHPVALITVEGQIIPVRVKHAIATSVSSKTAEKTAEVKSSKTSQPSRPGVRVILSPGQKLSRDTLARLQRLSYQLEHIPPLHLQAVDARDPDRILADYAEVDVIVGRLDSEVSERLARLVPLAPKVLELQKEVEGVDLRWSRQVTLQRRTHPLEATKSAQPSRQ